MKISTLAVLGLAAALGCGTALADDLYLGASYNGLTIDENGSAVGTGGGPIRPSTLNGTSLAWVYCVGLFTDVNVPADYPDTIVTHNGVADGAPIHNAGEIAWLLDHYANSANTADKQNALQAAIWTVEYNSLSLGTPVVTGDSGQSYYSTYTQMITALGSNTADVSTLDWLTPLDASGGANQALVAPTPEPGSVILLGTIGLAAAWLASRKRSALKA